MWTVELIKFLESYSWLILLISFLIGLSIKLYQRYVKKKALEEKLKHRQENNVKVKSLDIQHIRDYRYDWHWNPRRYYINFDPVGTYFSGIDIPNSYDFGGRYCNSFDDD